MTMQLSGPLTLVQARAIRTRLRRHFGLPKRGTDIAGNPVGPEVYSPGAFGWTDEVTPIIRIVSRGEWRIYITPHVAALIGQVVDGSTLNLGATTTREALLAGKTEDEQLADIQEVG